MDSAASVPHAGSTRWRWRLALFAAALLPVILSAGFVEAALWSGPPRFFEAEPILIEVGIVALVGAPLLLLTAGFSWRPVAASYGLLAVLAFQVPFLAYAAFCGGSPGSYCTDAGDGAEALVVLVLLAFPVVVVAIGAGTVLALVMLLARRRRGRARS